MPDDIQPHESIFRTTRAFKKAMKQYPHRLNVISEGDSWFGYPRKLSGSAGNMIDHIQDRFEGHVNLLRLEHSGDEIAQMLAGKQRRKLTKLLSHCKENGHKIHAILFSGGGNDIVGKYDMERFLKPYTSGMSAEACINDTAFKIKIEQIRYALKELANIRDQYATETKIFTHTYDLPYLTGVGVKLGPITIIKPWLSPAMKKRGIPEDDYSLAPQNQFRREIVQVLFGSLSTMLTDLEDQHPNFFVTDTLGTLDNINLWRNEIHPDTDGFDLITAKFYATMKDQIPELPNW
ncbi:MAG: hypothetical protein HWE25_03645 [Alphaproteobacteria bacterium]|nr:hypothetical protein [Alphaproteobacteria bacterium]